ncbi:cbb3-type cytochrome oxidase assembly protein CcoS [Kangiella sediminilitoris]|uniref:Cytochrome oxidase maturation protein, cbb3-type n=1 Tax=Kangiella sediminilitoris TaxID=1144748 RepID=A0A1B3BCY9_9GAMM|nr:cbb3-type cytochrome oxidase assembly protein CcoS [Kangiella sediminilitoris]AOE50597.1 hypothetical protein KS2013_1888 [Kangiella sediminilitoris]
MDAIFLLIPITFILLIVAIAVFFWAVNNDQYSDLDKEAHRIIFDQESPEEDDAEEQQQSASNQNSSDKAKADD